MVQPLITINQVNSNHFYMSNRHVSHTCPISSMLMSWGASCHMPLPAVFHPGSPAGPGSPGRPLPWGPWDQLRWLCHDSIWFHESSMRNSSIVHNPLNFRVSFCILIYTYLSKLNCPFVAFERPFGNEPHRISQAPPKVYRRLTSMCTYIYTYIWVYILVHIIYIYIHIYIYTYIILNIYIYTHSYIKTYCMI